MINNETGRSMVEMLGVLAIIGVLSVTGIKGFSMAMDKLRSTTISDMIGEVSVVAQTRNGCLVLEDPDDFMDELDDFEKPACVSKVWGGKSGQVKITFTTEDKCGNVENLVGSSFGKCRWEKDGDHSYIFVPTRGDQSGTCDIFVKDTCFK